MGENYTEMTRVVLKRLKKQIQKEGLDFDITELYDAVNKSVNLIHHEEIDAIQLITKNGMTGYCSTCGHCCQTYNIILRQEDIFRLSRLVDLSGKLKKSKDYEDYYTFQNKPCPYLKKDNRCGCYYLRPLTCRNYPLTYTVDGVVHVQRDSDCLFCVRFFVDKAYSILLNKPFGGDINHEEG